MVRRIIFYVIEALVLTIPIGLGFSLAARASRRFGHPVASPTAGGLFIVFLILCIIDTLLGEHFGPAVIPQYYVAVAILAGGVLLWMVTRVRRQRADASRSQTLSRQETYPQEGEMTCPEPAEPFSGVS